MVRMTNVFDSNALCHCSCCCRQVTREHPHLGREGGKEERMRMTNVFDSNTLCYSASSSRRITREHPHLREEEKI